MINYDNWLSRWDDQQSHYLPAREERFKYMLDIIEVHLGEDFTAIDLACGPGSLTQRLIERFPNARVFGVDVDPILLKLAAQAVGNYEGHVTWHEIDLRDNKWFDLLDIESVDVVLSTTALHWLPPEDLLRLYRQLSDIIRPGGLFMNGDHIRYGPQNYQFQEISESVKELWEEQGIRKADGESWDDWWDQIKDEFKQNDMADIVKKREEQFHWRDHHEFTSPSHPLQIGALQDAGFAEVDTIWQHLHNRILMAIR